MADDLAAERDEGHQVVGVFSVACEPSFVKAYDIQQITSCGMSGEENLVRIAAVLADMPEGPGDGRSRVVQAVIDADGIRQEAVLDRDDQVGRIGEVPGHRMTVIHGKPAAVEPDDDREAGLSFRPDNVQYTLVLECSFPVRDAGKGFQVLRQCG